ncbi:Mis6-domain-containing protein [Xylaria sp. CBS 124048]|nr:Mis6-domain-containing protein [Xylaria sp. CBS 124048]
MSNTPFLQSDDEGREEAPGEAPGHASDREEAELSSLESSLEVLGPLSDVIKASKLPAKQRETTVKPTVDTLASLAYEQGLLPADLKELIDLVTTPSFLDQASLSAIIRNLYPATSVSGHLIIKVIGCLGHGKLKPSLTIQAALLKWLIMVQHVVENRTCFMQAYPVLFNLLDTAALRTHLCHLLALITRRRHVRPYRIQALLELSRQTGNDPALTGLLRVYKDYYPEIIVGEATRGRASAFNHPDTRWRERLDEIQRAHAQRRASRAEAPLDAFRVARHRLNGTKNLPIPEVHTSHATENSITLEEIESVDGFVKNLEKIELPNQLIAILSDPLLQKLLLLRPQTQAHLRVSRWLNSYAQDMMSGDSEVPLVGILATLKSYVTATKTLPPIVLAFFKELLENWDGIEGRELILDILTYTPLVDFQELLLNIFRPLEQRILDGTAESQLQILELYTRLLRRWIVSMSSENEEARASDNAAHLIAHVNGLCLTLIQTSPCTSTQGKVLDFYYLTAVLAADPYLFTHAGASAVAPATLVYNLFFATSPLITSRVCTLVAGYKQGFQVAIELSKINYTPEHIPEFNGILMDICNCLWREHALGVKDANAKGCLIHRPIVDDLSSYLASLSTGGSLASVFSLSYSPAFSLFARSFLRELEEAAEAQEGLDIKHAGPVTKASLKTLVNRGGLNLTWDDYRRGVLAYLDKHDLSGVSQLLSITMGTLRQKK